ncbi:MAG: hypothetical protein ACWGMZ_08720 [Thermoguttaceae bacterium]
MKQNDSDKSADTAKVSDSAGDSKNKDSAKKNTAAEVEKPSLYGDPLAAGKLDLLEQEITAGLKKRQTIHNFARFRSYAAMKLNSSSGRYTGSELTGNCRLRWYDHLLRNPLEAPSEAERFTRKLHQAALKNQDGMAKLLPIAREKMDLGRRELKSAKEIRSPQDALEAVKQSIADAEVDYAEALAPLTKSQITELQEYIYPVLVGHSEVGHTINDRGTGRRLCDLMEIMDRDSLFAAAESLARLSDQKLLEQLKSLPAKGHVKVDGASGTIVDCIQTPCGKILIGGKGPNTYQLDKMRGVCCVIDLGGNDTYLDGTVGTARPVLVVIDLEGNDHYRGNQPGIQGGAILGVSMLLDLQGDDVYQARDMAQGSAIAGAGMLVDYAGTDRYIGFRRVQGEAVGGLGILIDRGGNDDYHAALWAQGVGGPLGFGLLDDLSGNDHYYCGGMWRNSYYPETPGCEGWGQGMGEGIRQVADGGIGLILDGAGDDVYEFDYLAHGGGYWCGLGFARDFGGNDQRLITRTAYNGGPRFQPSFQRFGCGWGCHYALGFLFDDSGDDVYEGTIMGTGMAWDCSVGVLCDFAGNDQYKATGGLTQGTGAQMGLGILFDYDGDDIYSGYGQGYASTNLSYHPLPDCGGNFSFMVDYGGKDNFGCGANNSCYIQRGGSGGYLIDRPRADEIHPTAQKTQPLSTAVK